MRTAGADGSAPVGGDRAAGKSSPSKPRLLFVVTEDWYFVSHRLSHAVAARDAGFDVSVATRVDRHGDVIRNAGIALLPLSFDRSGLGPLTELRTIRDLARIYEERRPDIVHHVALKPVIYGSIAARRARVPSIVNALGGLGYVFSNTGARARGLRSVVRPALKFALDAPNAHLIVQNSDDRQRIIRGGLTSAAHIHLIRGAGVDPEAYTLTNHETETPLIILPARLLREKGVAEFVAAARLLRRKGVRARFALVGRPDPANPASATEAEIASWTNDGIVESWGWRDNMPDVLASTQIVCLPTYYGEGLPKALLEGAASGCGLVATNIAGCREIVRDNDTGWLVPPRDVDALAAALEQAIGEPSMRTRFGLAARQAVLEDFSIERVVGETLAVYRALLKQSA